MEARKIVLAYSGGVDTLDLKDEFAENYVLPALKMNALYVNGARVLDSRPDGLYHD